MSLKILILEDDLLFASTLEDFLSESGFIVTLIDSCNIFWDKIDKSDYDLFIFDINLPDCNGMELLKSLREIKDVTPSIFLTSYRDKETLYRGFKSGCDDFISKPVDLDELLCRINAILIRVGKSLDIVKFENLIEYDFADNLFYKDGKILNMPLKAIKLFELFYSNRFSVISKDMIIDKLWGFNEDYSDGSIRVYISSLKKILPEGSISNLKGIGYKFELKI